MTPTKKIVTPKSGVEVEIKDWITGQDAEYIDQALMDGVEIQPDMARKTATAKKFNMGAIKELAHREIEKFVVSVAGATENVVTAVLDLPEEDYNFICDEIGSRRSKKKILNQVAGE